jgi:hypothetical protein
MKILALQTNVQEIQKAFVAEGEDVLLSTRSHFFAFLLPMIVKTIVFLVFVSVFTGYILMADEGNVVAAWLLLASVIVYAYQFFTSYIDWRFNYLIITTMKVVVVEQRSMFHNNIYPIHLENISSTSVESQFFGFFQCGKLHIHLKERVGGSTRDIVQSYVPSPDAVAGIVENAVALINQRTMEGEKKEEQQQKIETVQQKAEEVKGSVPPASPQPVQSV